MGKIASLEPLFCLNICLSTIFKPSVCLTLVFRKIILGSFFWSLRRKPRPMGTHILLFLIARGIHEIRESRIQGEINIVEPKVYFLIFETKFFEKNLDNFHSF